MTPDASAFSLAAYGQLLAALDERGYAAVGFDAVDAAARHLVLRHDVDVSLELAADFAEAEQALGYSAHYFVLVTAEQYNPASQDGRRALARITGAGHRIGLHFDAALECGEPLEARAVREADELSALAGVEVSMLSFHRPARAWIDNPAELAGMAHTYQPRFFSDIGYCSDSRGGWHHGPPLDHDAVKAGRALQLLTHPIWWVAEGRSPRERLSDFLARRHADMTRDLEANVVVPPDANNE